jgi:arylsulfatase
MGFLKNIDIRAVSLALRSIALLLSLGVVVGCSRSTDSAPAELPPHVVLIVVDTLAAKHLTTYGLREGVGQAILPQKIQNQRENSDFAFTPNLEQLADQSVVFEKSYSTAPWTKPSIASIFTSRYPRSHSVTRLQNKLPADQFTLAERFHKEGYYTAGVISHTLVRKGNGYEQGFENYRLVPVDHNVHYEITSHYVSDYGLEDLRRAKEQGKRAFLFLHYFDPHFNYMQHAEFDKSSWYTGKLTPGMGFRDLRAKIPEMDDADRDFLIDLYHEEISYTDKHIGRILAALRADPYFENTIIVFTADHGEEFLEHGALGHTRTMYDELIHVPLFISWPGNLTPTQVPEFVSGVDVAPTILALAGYSTAGLLSGKALFDNKKEPAVVERPIFAEVDFKSSGIRAWKSAVMYSGYKFVRDHLAEQDYLFDLLRDPDELKNLIGTSLPEESSLRGELGGFLNEEEKEVEAQELVHSPEELEQLRSLGYL